VNFAPNNARIERPQSSSSAVAASEGQNVHLIAWLYIYQAFPWLRCKTVEIGR
jgi:hypothetical protein